MNIYFVHYKAKEDEYDVYSVVIASSEEAVRKPYNPESDLRIKQIGVALEGVEEGFLLVLHPA
jgi:hypothetical protein